MLIIANAYRRLNLWNANAGASFEWVGRAINPYLGFLTGWLMVTGTLIGTLSPVIVLGPSVLAVFGASSNSRWPNVGIATAVAIVMLVIAALGIRLTARTQVVIAAVEYTILIGFSIAGLVWVLSHHAGSYPITAGWFSLHGIGGKGSLVFGFLLAVFIFTGWDGTIYVNEEVVHRRKNPGRAAMFAVIIVTVFFVLAQVGLQGVVSPGKLQNNSSSALVYVSGVMGGGGWAKVMALALALSVVAATGTGIVLGARILYGMASHRVLPEFLGNVSPRFATPIAASIVSGLFILVVTWIYLLANSVQSAFTDVINVTGVIYASFYVLTALAAIVYYRRRVVRSPWDAITLGILPLAAIAFLVWIVVRQLQNSPATQRWSLIGVVGVGLILMLVARFVLRSPFFHIARESDSPGAHRGGTRAA
jgi:amino acid transporter